MMNISRERINEVQEIVREALAIWRADPFMPATAPCIVAGERFLDGDWGAIRGAWGVSFRGGEIYHYLYKLPWRTLEEQERMLHSAHVTLEAMRYRITA